MLLRLNRKGFSLIELLIAILIIGILALIGMPSYVKLRYKAYNSSALSAGSTARLTMEVAYTQDEKYPPNLEELLKYQGSPNDDPGVTFLFGPVNNSGYTFTTMHINGNESYVWK